MKRVLADENTGVPSASKLGNVLSGDRAQASQTMPRAAQPPPGQTPPKDIGKPSPRKHSLRVRHRAVEKSRPQVCKDNASANTAVATRASSSDTAKKSALQRLKSAVTTVKVTNRLGNYKKLHTNRTKEDARKKAEKKQLKHVWNSTDLDGSGVLDRAELRQVLLKMGKKLSEMQLDTALAEIDNDGSGQVEFAEFEVWWDREMASNIAILPKVFNFRGVACRAIRLDPRKNEYHWVAQDVAHVLYPVQVKPRKMSQQEKDEARRQEVAKLRAIWDEVDADGGGRLDWEELGHVFELMGRTMGEGELDEALNDIDKDGGGDVDFGEFMKWWQKQDSHDTARIQRNKGFVDLLRTLQPNELTVKLLSGPRGPEEVKLVSPQGLLRLVLRAKSHHAKEFHEWAEAVTSSKQVQAGASDLQPDRLPPVIKVKTDFDLRNLLISTASRDEWFYFKSVASNNAMQHGILHQNDIKLFTMDLPSKQIACLLAI